MNMAPDKAILELELKPFVRPYVTGKDVTGKGGKVINTSALAPLSKGKNEQELREREKCLATYFASPPFVVSKLLTLAASLIGTAIPLRSINSARFLSPSLPCQPFNRAFMAFLSGPRARCSAL